MIDANSPTDPLADSAISLAPAASRRVFLRENRAVLVIERRDPGSNHEAADAIPAGWNWTIGNATLARVLGQALAAVGADLAATLLPEEHASTLAQTLLEGSSDLGAAPSVVSYNGLLKLRPVDVGQISGDPVFFIINGHQFPLCDLKCAVAAHRAAKCDVTVFDVQLQRGPKAYEEKLRVDSDGRVSRVDRLYDAAAEGAAPGRDWPALMIVSPAAMRRLTDAPLPRRLDQWPAHLLRSGLKIQGATLAGRAFDLHDADQIRELADELLRSQPEWVAAAGNLVPSDHYPRVWMGSGVKIGQNVEFVGPVMIGDSAEIGDDAVIVGPTAIGKNGRVASGALLRRRVLPEGAVFHADAISDARTARGAAMTVVERLTRRSVGRDRPIRLQSVLEASTVPRYAGARHSAYLAAKRVMDVVGATVFLCGTLIFFPLIALAIKINSPGPIFYGHQRQGRGGKNFKCWKFRTMVVNAEQIKDQFRHKNEVDGPQFKIKDDPRIFFVGKWLRKLNMDEWPQFFNVLKGDMSLVGPRPSPEKENQMCPAWREARLTVRPGITGLWQVSRQRGDETDFQEWIYYDVQYVKKQSIPLDVKILMKTFRVALKGS